MAINFKTILVHLANDQDHGKRLALGIDLAKRHGAHLVALFVTRPLGMVHEIAGRGASALYLAQQNERALELAAQLEQEFKQTCSRENLTYSWIVEDGEHLESLAQHAHAADLVIVSRGPSVHLEDRVRLRLAEELTMVSGMPVLVLPTGYNAKPIGKRVLIAWKGTREAVRAIGDALPFLTNAEKVVLASVAEDTRDALSHLEVHQHLERHGVPIESLALQVGQGSVGDTLLQAAHDHSCDMIVLGAYSRARWREVMFGGVTRELFTNSTLPLLMSH